MIRGTDFHRIKKGDLSTCPYRYHKEYNYKSRKLKPLDIILEVSGGTQEQPVGRTVLVTRELIENFENRVICASFCKLLRLEVESISPYYFYYWMKFLYDTRIIDKYQLQSTGIINFKFEYFLKKGTVIVPPKDVMQLFDEKVIPLFKIKENIVRQNQILTKQRDMLLPRLMSGKLEV